MIDDILSEHARQQYRDMVTRQAKNAPYTSPYQLLLDSRQRDIDSLGRLIEFPCGGDELALNENRKKQRLAELRSRRRARNG